MDKEIILFDWDDTLSSKVEYKNNLRINLAKICGVSEEEIFKVDEKYFQNLAKSGDFQMDTFIATFENKFDRKIDLNDFSSDRLRIYSSALFPETISVLNSLKKRFILGVYSQGFVNLQMIKIRESGIKNFFNRQHIYLNRDKLDLKFVAQLPNSSTIVDDKREVIERLQQLRSDLKLIRIDRENSEETSTPQVRIIRNLRELL
jgi:hypothetical protein